jgi:pyridoxal/pyridoxine/pyridoxamine kinase
MAFVPTDPVTAKQISMHTSVVLDQIKACDQLEALEKIYTGYAAYSKSMNVTSQIVEHVQKVFNETATLIKAKQKAKEREEAQRVAERMTGDAAHAE